MSYIISIEPNERPGKVTARSTDGASFLSRQPLLDGARHCAALGAPSSAAIVTVWSSGTGAWAMRGTIGYASRFTVDEDPRPYFRAWRSVG